METSIVVAFGTAVVAFIGGWLARAKVRADTRKVEVETENLIITRLDGEIVRLVGQVAELRETVTKLLDTVTTTSDEVTRLCDLAKIASAQLAAGEPEKAEATLAKADDGEKAKT